MTLIIGFLVVLGSTIGAYLAAQGKLESMTILAWTEYVSVLGISLGLMIIATPLSVLKNLANKIKISFRNQAVPTEEYLDALKLLYELFTKARRGGLIAIEDDVVTPDQSQIFQKYPSFLNDHERREFLCNGLKPIIDGRLKPEQLAQMLEGDLEAKHEDFHLPVQTLNLVGDSLPGIGIVAAVMGIINTMGKITQGAEKVGQSVGAALVGTFLGVFVAYGFVNPLGARIKLNNVYELQYFTLLMKGIVGFTGGMAPLMAVEYARRAIDPAFQPSSEEVENMVKSLGAGS